MPCDKSATGPERNKQRGLLVARQGKRRHDDSHMWQLEHTEKQLQSISCILHGKSASQFWACKRPINYQRKRSQKKQDGQLKGSLVARRPLHGWGQTKQLFRASWTTDKLGVAVFGNIIYTTLTQRTHGEAPSITRETSKKCIASYPVSYTHLTLPTILLV